MMKASETKLQQILEGTKQYVVPLFQRSYSWEKKEWDVLWNDLIELCDMDNPRTHFIGSIVTMPTNSVPEGVAKYLLIDGQQRLTTIFILLSLLRNKAEEADQKQLAAEINSMFLTNPFTEGLDHYKLLPTQVDRPSFQNLIKLQKAPYGDKIGNAYEFFERKLRQEHIDAQTLKRTISQHLSVVSIVLDREDDPHLVFESLNAKGRPLTQSDLIRNYFFMKIHVNEQERIHSQYWEPMQNALQDNLTEYIRHYLMKEGTFVKQTDVYFFLKDVVSQRDALACLQDLACFARYYEKFIEPEKEPNSQIRQALIRLKRLEVATAYPFLLNCYHAYSQKEITAEEFVAVLGVIENFILRRFVCNVSTKPLNKIFSSLCSQMKNTDFGNVADRIKAFLQSKDYPKDTEFQARLLDTKLYGAGDRAIKTRLILEALEESYHHKEPVSFVSLSIEHIMPQTLTEVWQEHLGENWEATHELSLHTLGNLTLTAYNSELSNDPWEIKREKLAESHLEMNKYFRNKLSWVKEDIDDRAKHLAEIALTIWPYFGDPATAQQEHKKATGTTPQKMYILGQEFSVHSWRDVLERTMITIADLEPEKFEQIMQQYPRLIGRDKKKFRAVRELINGIFLEVNLSAHDIQRFCFQVIETADLSADDLQVEIG